MKRGVLYIVFGENFVKEMLFSAESVKKHNPELHITAFCDKPVESEFIDDVRIINVGHLRPKIDYIHQSPYDQTLFLDTDTIITYDISDMFDLLEVHDMALVHDLARKRLKYAKTIPEYENIPYAFSELNTGVIVFSDNEKTKALFKRWKDNFYKYQKYSPWDQPTFRISLWETIKEDNLSLYVMPVEYNIRSKANREKQRRFHHEFGEAHLHPRIFHMHADTRINQGTYEIKTMDEALEIMKKNFMEY